MSIKEHGKHTIPDSYIYIIYYIYGVRPKSDSGVHFDNKMSLGHT